MSGDPVNLAGTCDWYSVGCRANEAVHNAAGAVNDHIVQPVLSARRQFLRFAALFPYALYYGGYKMNKWAARGGWSRIFKAPLRPLGWAMQVGGIAGDARIDIAKGESVWDEHHHGSWNPFHKPGATGPFLPGLYWRNGPRLDFAW